jgi:hypothetical protein
MPAGPQLRSVREIRKVLEGIPDAILYDDPRPERAPSGESPATEISVSDPDRSRRMSLTDAPLGRDGDVDEDQDESSVDEPVVIFEVPPSVTAADLRHALGQDKLDEIDRLYQLRAMDAFGWYTTFHQNRVQYGVHIPVEGVIAFAGRVFSGLGLPVERMCELAFHAILRHELFHFNVDCMAANWEMATGVPVYWRGKDQYRNGDGYVELEEALANAYMLRGFKNPTRLLRNAPGAYQALKRLCEMQPAGYKDGPRYVRTRAAKGDSYFGASYKLSEMYQHESAASWLSPEALDVLIFYPDLIRIDWARCPIIILDEDNLLERLGIGVSYFQTVEICEETESFRRSYSKLDGRLQKLWDARKSDLARSTALKKLDFKQWKQDGADVYSVRLDGNFRAHVRYDRGRRIWLAEKVGDHKAMRHG